jgi:hypothetical protein
MFHVVAEPVARRLGALKKALEGAVSRIATVADGSSVHGDARSKYDNKITHRSVPLVRILLRFYMRGKALVKRHSAAAAAKWRHFSS